MVKAVKNVSAQPAPQKAAPKALTQKPATGAGEVLIGFPDGSTRAYTGLNFSQLLEVHDLLRSFGDRS